MDRPTLEFASNCKGIEFGSPQVNELIGSSHTFGYCWIFNLAGKYVPKKGGLFYWIFYPYTGKVQVNDYVSRTF